MDSCHEIFEFWRGLILGCLVAGILLWPILDTLLCKKWQDFYFIERNQDRERERIKDQFRKGGDL